MERVVSSFFARTPPTIYTQKELKPNSGFGVLFMDSIRLQLGVCAIQSRSNLGQNGTWGGFAVRHNVVVKSRRLPYASGISAAD
jgi:hypothetical protein